MSTAELTRLLDRAGEGDRSAWDAVFDRVYDELQLLARRQRSRWTGDDTLNTTALVHEAWLKLVRPDRVTLRSRGHFFALASRAMRQILCNHARDRRAQKRGGDRQPVTLQESLVDHASRSVAGGRLDDLDEALTRLEADHPRAARIVECRFFGGLSVQETADALEISPRTVKREWRFAQAWLQGELTGGNEG